MDNTHSPVAKIARYKSDDESSGEKKDEEVTPCMVDRISELPVFIIHHILSFLDPLSEMKKTSLLSKLWYHSIYASFPNLYFLEPCRSVSASDNYNLLNFVDKSLSRYQSNGFKISKFCLCITNAYDISCVVAFVDKWIRFLLQNQTEDLHISLHKVNRHEEVFFPLPPDFFSTNKLLKKVSLHGCGIDSPWSMDKIKFGSLQDLSLSEVLFKDDKVISYIIFSCPLLEKITLQDCDGLKSLQLHGLDKLTHVHLASPSSEISIIDIKTPSLQSFSYDNDYFKNTTPRIEMGTCKNLRDLSLLNIQTPDWPFSDFISQFPLLEELVLEYCTIEELGISSECLKKIDLTYIYDLCKVEIDAPNLLFFDFYCRDFKLPLIYSTNPSGLWEAKVYFFGYLELNSTMWQELRGFLLKSKHFKLVTIFYTNFGQSEFYLDEFQSIESFPEAFELENLKLRIHRLSQNYEADIEYLMWCCHPHILTLEVTEAITNSPYTTKFIKDMYKKLGHEVHTCYGSCSSGNQYEKKVEIELFDPMSREAIPIDMAALLRIIPTIKSQEINFRLNW